MFNTVYNICTQNIFKMWILFVPSLKYEINHLLKNSFKYIYNSSFFYQNFEIISCDLNEILSSLVIKWSKM